jgi:anaerobic selenocysteine-containing dehydrogenase
MFGHQLLLPIPDIDRARVFLILGANPLASNGSLMTAPDIKERLRAIQARDGRIIVVDPRRTETAELADEHLFIRPGTDAWFLLGLLHSVLEHDAKLGHLAEHTDGLHRLKDAVGRFTPERAADMTGIEASSIRSIARLLRETESAVCYGRLGTSTQKFGGLCQWLINALNLVTGHFDRLGGAMFPEPAIDPLTNAAGFGIGPGSHGRWKSRVRGLAEFGGELPASTLAEEIETEGAGRLRALVTLAGNPALSTPNGARLERALGTLDFMVSIDMYLNETTRHAHVILPVPSALERVQYDLPFHMLAVRNTAKLSMPLFERAPSERHEWEILLELTERLARLRGQRIQAAKARALRAAGPLRVLDLGLRAGPHGPRLSPPSRGLSARRLLKHPHGIDLGPLRPCLLERMPKGRRIDIAPAPFIADLDRLERDSVPPGPSTDAARFQLIGRRHLRSNNSWMHNVPKLVRGQNRCTLLMHPADRAHIGAARGGWVTIRSRVGEIRVEVEDSDAMMRGVVSLPHGFGHDRDGVRLRVARSHAGASMNDVTDELELDALSGNAVLSGFEVEVTAS